MNDNRLFTIYKKTSDSEEETLRAKETKYLLSLRPHEAIKELRAKIRAIAEKVEYFTKSDLHGPEQIERLRDLVFELEVAQEYLVDAFKAWQARQ